MKGSTIPYNQPTGVLNTAQMIINVLFAVVHTARKYMDDASLHVITCHYPKLDLSKKKYIIYTCVRMSIYIYIHIHSIINMHITKGRSTVSHDMSKMFNSTF